MLVLVLARRRGLTLRRSLALRRCSFRRPLGLLRSRALRGRFARWRRLPFRRRSYPALRRWLPFRSWRPLRRSRFPLRWWRSPTLWRWCLARRRSTPFRRDLALLLRFLTWRCDLARLRGLAFGRSLMQWSLTFRRPLAFRHRLPWCGLHRSCRPGSAQRSRWRIAPGLLVPVRFALHLRAPRGHRGRRDRSHIAICRNPPGDHRRGRTAMIHRRKLGPIRSG